MHQPVTRHPRTCPACGDRPDRLLAYRWRGRAYCRPACRDAVRDAYSKTQHDLADRTRNVCRCPGAPQPMSLGGDHCVHCRCLFSFGVRQMLVDRASRRRRVVWLRRLLYTELHLHRPLTPA
jgi:hypothetical protein